MPNDSKLLDDLARVAGGAASLISTVRRQIRSDLRGRMDSYTDRMDLASRSEIERLQALVASFRSEQEALKERITELETLVKGKKTSAKKTSSRPAKPKRK
jgi:BMFP domain-containing protein YqiC